MNERHWESLLHCKFTGYSFISLFDEVVLCMLLSIDVNV